MMVIEFGVGGGPVPAFAGYTEAHRGVHLPWIRPLTKPQLLIFVNSKGNSIKHILLIKSE